MFVYVCVCVCVCVCVGVCVCVCAHTVHGLFIQVTDHYNGKAGPISMLFDRLAQRPRRVRTHVRTALQGTRMTRGVRGEGRRGGGESQVRLNIRSQADRRMLFN